MSKLYKGAYNYQGQIHNLWTHAKNQTQAHRHFLKQLQKILGLTMGYRLRCHFTGQRDNFKIKQIEKRSNNAK